MSDGPWVIHVSIPTKDGPKTGATSVITSRAELEASLAAFREWRVMGLIKVVGVSRVMMKGVA